MDYTKFIQDSPEEIDEKLIKKFNEITKEDPNNANIIIEDESIYSIFYVYNDTVAMSKFYSVKRFLILLYEWLIQQKYADKWTLEKIKSIRIEDVLSETFVKQFLYKNLDSILEMVCEVGNKIGLSNEEDLLDIKSLVILMFYGVEYKDIIDIKKSDLYGNKIKVGNEIITLDDKSFKILSMYAETDPFSSFPSGKSRVRVPSDFLFRSSMKNKLTSSNLRFAFARFNEVAKDYYVQLDRLRLYKNGMFVRIYEVENNYESIQDAIREVTKVKSRGSVYDIKELYEVWKRVYMN